MNDTDTSRLHVFSNGTDTIFGESVEEALRAYCQEIGERFEDYPSGPTGFKMVQDDKEITVIDDCDNNSANRKRTLTARQWIEESVRVSNNGHISRLICSTEY